MAMAKSTDTAESGFDIGYDGHQRRQARLGLAMTAAERLAWLERKLTEMRGLLGKARPGRAKAATACEPAEPRRGSKE
jgi:hypothetical protein